VKSDEKEQGMIRGVIVVLLLLAATSALASDPGGLRGLATSAGKQVGQSTSDVALNALTQKLKKVQNEHGPIRFVTGKAEIDPACDRTMQQIASIMAEYPGFKVQVDGHTDSVGRADANQRLSQARAEAVVNYLVQKKGVSAKRLSAKGWGDQQPIADNASEAGRAQNRRVDFTVTKI
jgi:outer membrane protein OmpA-like peptidoglycan-associated protein